MNKKLIGYALALFAFIGATNAHAVTYRVGGTVSGLASGKSVVLRNNNFTSLVVSSNGGFAFPSQAQGGSWSIAVGLQPAGQLCTVTNASGTGLSTNVTSVRVNCIATTYTVSGTVTGNTGAVTLKNNRTDSKTVPAGGGAFTFSAQTYGSNYAVSVTSPIGQICTVTNGVGFYLKKNITNVVVNCVTRTFRVSGRVSGNAGTLTVTNNGGDAKIIPAGGGAFIFSAQGIGSSYLVAAVGPTNQACTVLNGKGTLTANVMNVVVYCTIKLPTYAVGGTISGLSGSVTLSLNGTAQTKTLNANGMWSFDTGLTRGSSYLVRVSSQPAGQFCSIVGSNGLVLSSNVSSVKVTCVTSSSSSSSSSRSSSSSAVSSSSSSRSSSASSSIGSSSSSSSKGSASSSLASSSSSRSSTSSATSSLSSSVSSAASSASSSVTSSTSSLASSSSSIASSSSSSSSSASSSSSSSSSATYVVSGTVSGLGAGKSIVLQNNGANDQTVTNPATIFSFPAQSNANTYNVTVLTQPVGQTCSVLNGSGTLAGANVTNVSVMCTDTTYTVGGSISGLSASGLSLSLSGSKSGTVSPASGSTSYVFSQTLVNGNSYTVTISAQPKGQTCTLSPNPATGTVGTTNIVVNVTCTVNAYTIAVTNSSAAAVTISGSTATNATNPNSATSFNFSAKHGDAVVLSGTKTGNTCTVATTPASINPITGNATATVSCTLNTYSVGGTNTAGASVSISGTTLTGQAATTANSYSFNAKYGEGVTLTATKAGYTCTVAGSPITVGATNVTTANVSCIANTYTVSGTTDGATVVASGSTVSNTVTVNAGTYSVSAKSGDTVILTASKTGYSGCVIAASPVTVAAANVTNANVSCIANTYTITVTNTPAASVSISGSTATNATNPNSAASFTFIANYGDNVSFSANKAGYDCSVTPSSISPIIGDANVTVACSSLKIGGAVTGLGVGNSVRLLKTIGNNAPSVAAVSFAAPTDMPAEISGAGNYGWSFSLVGSQKVSALGLYNNDFTSDVQVGLWDLSGTLLASGVFSGSLANLDLSDVGVSGFIWLPVAEVTLGPGLYTVGAYSSTDHFASYNVTVNPISGLTINKYSLMTFNSVFEAPTEDLSAANPYGFFGPNIKFSGMTATNESLDITSNGSFYFPTPVSSGDAYTVTVETQPVGQTCEVLNGVGVVGLSTVTTVQVNCITNTYSISVTNGQLASVDIAGSTAANATNPNSGANFDFFAKYGDNVSLSATKAGYSCSVTPSTINPVTANADATVSCTLNTYTISITNTQGATVTISGSTATNVINPNSATSFNFLANPSNSISLSAAKTGYTCTVTPASIPSIAANASASVSCTSAGTYTVSGKLTGNTGTVTLLNNGTNSTSVLRPKGTFSFSSGLGDGSAYNVTVSANPTGQICLVLNGSGVIAAANISNVVVSCATNTYTLGGTVSGLGNGLSVVLLKNGSDALSINANGSFTFASPMAAGAYVVSIGTQPLGQSCVITNGSGAVGTTDITNITVTCSTNVNGCSSAGNAATPSTDPFWAIYSAPTSPGVDTTPLITSELPNMFQSCLQPT